MKKYLILCLFANMLVSCEKRELGGSSALSFIPRQVSQIFILPGERIFYSHEGHDVREYGPVENPISGDNLFFSIQTSNNDPRVAVSQLYPDLDPNPNLGMFFISFSEYLELDTPIPTIEQQIRLDYDRWVKKLRRNDGNSYMTFEQIEYRTTQIKNLTISTLDKPLFGKAAGESLNEFFDISEYEPPVIVSAPTNTLVYGYSDMYIDGVYPTTIEEWLDLSPLAQTNMWLFPNKKMDGLPMNVQFVVQMETAEGVVLSDTTRVLTLTE